MRELLTVVTTEPDSCRSATMFHVLMLCIFVNVDATACLHVYDRAENHAALSSLA